MYLVKILLADYSIIELIIYGLIGYTGIIVLVVSVLIDPPKTRSFASARSVWLTPSLICIGLLMFSGGEIILNDGATTTTITTSNVTAEEWTEVKVEEPNTITMVNPVWITIHLGLFLIMIVYILQQMLIALTKSDD